MNQAFAQQNLKVLEVIAKQINPYGESNISEQEINESAHTSVSELLSSEPSLNIQQIGGLGNLSLIQFHGLSAEYTTILIDGVKLEDPSNYKPYFDIGQIPTGFIKEIEIIPGSSSVLYGSGAVGGVINIKTLYEQDKFFVHSQLGSFQTYNNQLGVSYTAGDFYISSFASVLTSAGYSAAKQNLYEGVLLSNPQDDKSLLADIHLKTIYKGLQGATSTFFIKVNSTKTQYDGYDMALSMPIDADNEMDKATFMTYLVQTFDTALVDHEFIASIIVNDSLFKEEQWGDTRYLGKTFKGQYKGQMDWSWGHMTAGTEISQQKMNNEANTLNDYGYFLSFLEQISPELTLEQGIRLNVRKQANHLMHAYSLGAIYDIKNIMSTISAKYGRSFRLPSLSELYGFGGNSLLEPEYAHTLIIGLNSYGSSQYISKPYLNFFYNDIDNKIVSNNFILENHAEFSNYGIKIGTDVLLFTDNLKWSPNYVYQKPLLGITNISKHTLYNTLAYTMNQFSSILQTATYSSFYDISGMDNIKLPSYTVLNAKLTYTISLPQQEMQVYFKVNNLLDKKYEILSGYNTVPLSVFLGFKLDHVL